MGRRGDVWNRAGLVLGRLPQGGGVSGHSPLAQAPPTVARGSRGEGKELLQTCGILITCSSEDSSCHSDALWGAGVGGAASAPLPQVARLAICNALREPGAATDGPDGC